MMSGSTEEKTKRNTDVIEEEMMIISGNLIKVPGMIKLLSELDEALPLSLRNALDGELLDGNASNLLNKYSRLLEKEKILIDEEYLKKWVLQYIDDRRTKKKPFLGITKGDEALFGQMTLLPSKYEVMPTIKNKREEWETTLYRINTKSGTITSVLSSFEKNWRCIDFRSRENVLQHYQHGTQYYYYYCKCQRPHYVQSNTAFNLICVKFSAPKKLLKDRDANEQGGALKLNNFFTSVVYVKKDKYSETLNHFICKTFPGETFNNFTNSGVIDENTQHVACLPKKI
jgi:hypothetical protein